MDTDTTSLNQSYILRYRSWTENQGLMDNVKKALQWLWSHGDKAAWRKSKADAEAGKKIHALLDQAFEAGINGDEASYENVKRELKTLGATDAEKSRAAAFYELHNSILRVQKVKSDPEIALEYILANRYIRFDEPTTRKIEEYLAFLKENDVAVFEQASKAYEKGKRLGELLERPYQMAFMRDPDWDALKREFASASPSVKECKLLEEKIQKAIRHAEELMAPRTARAITPPDYDTSRSCPYFIGNLAPAAEWTVAIDETGSDFSSAAATGETTTDEGRMVAVLIPIGCDLPRLEGNEHAVTDGDDATVGRLEALLHATPCCGILGVSLRGMAAIPEKTRMDYWYNELERIFDLVLRFLPLGDAPTTKIRFLVEKRGMAREETDQEMLDRTWQTSLYRLTRSTPERADRLQIEASMERKHSTTNEDFHAYNGYVDAVAFSWHCKDSQREPRRALRAYGLLENCLLSSDPQLLIDSMDRIADKSYPSSRTWSELMERMAGWNPPALLRLVTEELGAATRNAPSLWRAFAEETKRHVDSHAIRLHMLKTEIDWLKANRPAEMDLPPRLELLWLTLQLANANHHGETGLGEASARFRELGETLFEEDAPLVCQAYLHLAIEATNSYEFDRARNVLAEFVRLANDGETPESPEQAAIDLPPALVGLRCHGQLLSSLGQMAAFRGKDEQAIDLFQRAILDFEKLSENRDGDIDQTKAYLATVTMDCPCCDSGKVRMTMENYLGEDLAAAAADLAVSTEPAEKYRHHILLRCLVSPFAADDVRTTYLARKDDWSRSSDGHPYEMIEFYRALLSDRPDVCRLQKASRILGDHPSGVLGAIAAVILNARLSAGDTSAKAPYDELCKRLASELPDLGPERIATLQAQRDPATRLSPLEFAAAILPFNFR